MFVLLFCFSLADWRDQKYGDWVEFLGRRWAWLERSKTTIRHGGVLHWFVFDFCLGLCVCVCVCVCVVEEWIIDEQKRGTRTTA